MQRTILLFAGILLVFGCDDLDPALPGTLSPNNFPLTEEDYELYTFGVYKPFGSKWGYDLTPDDNTNGYRDNLHAYEFGHIYMFDGPADNMAIYVNGWGGFFEAITRGDFEFFISQDVSRSHLSKVSFVTQITQIIADLEQADIPTETQLQLLAEARLARGWLMYYLLHLYGPVPVILDASLIGTDAELDVARPDRAQFVRSMEADLEFASDPANGLPDVAWDSDDFYGRFTRGFALTLLMRAQMNEGNFEVAEQTGRAITAMGYSLVTGGTNPYKSLFQVATQRNTENIFAVTVDHTSDGQAVNGNINAWTWYCYPGDYPGEYQQGGWSNPQGVFMAHWDFYDSFDPIDLRRELYAESYTSTGNSLRDRSNLNGAVVLKYPEDIENPGAFQGNDIIIARYADVLLMLAEAINENSGGPTAEAIDLVNQVRNRSNLGDLPAADIIDREAFNDAILRERGWELFFEGVRKMDLIRHDRWEENLLAKGKQADHRVLPIPIYALDQGFEQNDSFK